MIDCYFAPTPNGQKVSILLEETGLPYTTRLVNILKGEQFEPEFLKISPNNKIPAIVDHDGPGGKTFSVFESGAILMYLAEKTNRFLPKDRGRRYDVIQWLMFQMGTVGPMFGQTHHFFNYAPTKIPYAMNRYKKETQRIYSVLDKRLSENEFIAAGEYTIADISIYPWVAAHKAHQVHLSDFPNVKKWTDMMKSRDAVQKGFNLMRSQIRDPGTYDDESKKILFGIDKESGT